MDSITISTGREQTYRVVFGSLNSVGDQVAAVLGSLPEKCLLVTDSNVGPLYAKTIQASLLAAGFEHVEVYTVPAGEQSKNLASFQEIIDWALSKSVDRKTPLVALGGGVVGDLAGFAAASLLRGLPLVHVPTTLTSQVDSSIGGKTGVNHSAGKNLVGAFYPPRLVLADPSTLSTLPIEEWRSGLAEVIKHAYIAGKDSCNALLSAWDSVSAADTTNPDWIAESASVKSRIVQEDEHESGTRMWLNLGHTTGHAIERTTSYGTFTHGEAVAFGLTVAIELSKELGSAVDGELAYRLLNEMDLQARLEMLDPSAIYAGTSTDKKNASGKTRFILLKGPGQPYLNDSISVDDFRKAWTIALTNL